MRVHEQVPSRPLFDATRLVLGAPSSDVAVECRALLALQNLRTQQREMQITSQAVGDLALLPLLSRR